MACTLIASESQESSSCGFATLLVMMALAVVGTATSVLVLTSVVETHISASTRDTTAALHAAEAAAQRALRDLRALDWAAVPSVGTSPVVDGPPSGVRTLADGSPIDLDAETADLTCGRRRPCTDTEVSAVTDSRPWGSGNPRWRLFLQAPMNAVAPGTFQPLPLYLVVWIADDPTEVDADPAVDGRPDEPGHGVLLLAARAYGPRGVRRTVQLAVERAGSELRLLTQHEYTP